MTTITHLLDRTTKRLLRRFVKPDALDPAKLLKDPDDDHVRTMAYAAAGLFKAIKVEAERRGIWDDIKTKKVPA